VIKLRASSPEEHLALKSAVKRCAKLAGGAASVQHMTRVGEAELSRYASSEHGDRHCPIDVAIDLDREAGHPVILEAMAALLGYRLVPADEAAEPVITPVELANVCVEASGFVAAVADAGDVIDCNEARRIDIEAEEAVGAIRRVQRAARALRAGFRRKA
jgi:hypothetical protein